MTKAKTNRLLLLGVLLIALLTMAMGFGISANAEGEPEIYWTLVVDPDGEQLGTLEIGSTSAAPRRGLHFSTTDNELIIQTVGQLYLRGSADEIERLSLDSVTAADITLMDCGLANAVMSLNASTEYDIKLRPAEGTTNYLHSIAKGDSSGSLTIRGKGMLSLARIYGDPLTNVTFDGCVVTVDATTVGGSSAVPAIGCDEYYSPEEINDHVYNIVIKNGASVKATGKTYDDYMFGYIYGTAIGSSGTIIYDEDAYKVNGSAATVYNGEGQPVVLMEIENPTEADVRIDGVDVFDKHGDEQMIYAYVTAEDHIVNLGDTVVNYTYSNGRFDNYIHGTQFIVSATNSGETLVYGDDYTYTEDNGVLTIMSDKAITIANADDVEVSNHRILVAQDVEVDITLNGVNIDVSSKNDTGAFVIYDNSTGDVTVTLADGSVNVLKSGSNCAGLQKNGPGEDIGMLTICGTGSLLAQGGTSGAGIGGGNYSTATNITITDKAVVTATGGVGGAGIGGGYNGLLDNIIISGGSVNAIGSTYSDSFYGDCPAPAIGSGVQTGDYVLEDGEPVTPTLADGTTPVYLLEIDNPNGEDIVIDGVDYPDSHGSETKIYAYVTAENHTVKVGNTSTVYEYNNGSFIEFVHGKQFSVSATKSGETLVYGKDYTYSQRTKVLNILSDKAITIANADGVYEADDHINVAKNVNADITLAGVYINVSSGAAFAIEGYGTGNVTVTLAKDSVNILQSGEDFAGINKNDDESTLTITGEGSLTAQGGAYAPGIGAGEATSNITIKGGNITATGGDGGAGIGGGYNGTSRNITITGTAVVTATGYGGAAGIGGGYNGTLEDIFITGGSVKAVGGIYVDEYYGNAKGAPIGGGVYTYIEVLQDGDPVTPTLADGTTPVYLLEIDNPNGEDIVIDGVDYPDKHGDETKIYAYVTAENHTVKVGDTSTVYEYYNGAFTEIVHGTDLSVSATNSGETLVHGVDYTYSSATGILTVLTDKAITIANADGVDETDDRIFVADGVNADITLAGVNISASNNAAFAIADNSTGDVTLTLADGSVNTLKSANYYAGLQKNGADENVGTLTIRGTGYLTAQGGSNGAGIGGGDEGSATDITISDKAVVTATGGDIAAGIGGGFMGSAANITITDKAVVTATGGDGGAGIGGGRNGDLEDIIISGGSVKAVGSTMGEYYAPAIGSGVTNEDGYYYDGAYVIPRLADGRTLGYLLEISNPNGEDIVIDGIDFPDSHGDETKIYAYVTSTFHTVKVGDTSTVYEYYNGAFTEMVHGTDLSVSATNSGETLEHGVDYTYSSATGILTVLTDKAITIANADGVEETDDRIFVADGVDADITLAGVNISASDNAAFAIANNSTGDVTLTLADGSVNTLKSANNYAGLQKNGADENVGTLTICGTGSLSAQGGIDSAGIGGANKSSTGNITISGRVVITATGGDIAAGIGGGYGGSAEDITITDNAVVTATGGAGIGGGKGGSATDIKITDKAVVTASGKDGGAGIGGGVDGTLEDIIINGGSVNAIGSYYYEETVGGADGANIGGGVILPPDPFSEPEEGAPVTPTLADGTTPVYLFEIDNPNGADISIDGVDFPDKHCDEKKIYAYVTGKNHIVKFNDTAYLYVFSDGSFTRMNEMETLTLNVPTTTGKSVGLSWNDLGDTVSYEVYRSATGSDFVKIATADGTAYTDNTVVAGNRYYYQIKAYYSEYDVYGVSDIERVTVLDAPVIVKVTYGDDTVTLTWNKVAGADHYSVHLMNSPAFDGMTTVGDTAETTITLNDLPEDKYLVVCAMDTETGGISLFSASVPTTIPVPKNISTEAGDKQVTLTWDAVEGATKYNVYIYTTGYKLLATVTDTSYTATGLTNGTKYGFLVRAFVNGAWTAFTTADNVYATPVAAIKPVVTATAGEEQVKLSWNALDGATNYRVFSYLNGKYAVLGETTATTYTASDLTAGTKYGFLVRALVNGAWTAFSNDDVVYATPTAAVVTKPEVTATAGDGEVDLTWNAIEGATKYNVYIYTTGYKLLTTTTETSYTASDLENGTKYGFLVRAYVNGTWTTFTTADNIYATPEAAVVTKPVVTATACDSEVELEWNAVTGATKYNVYIYTTGYKLLTTTTSTSYTATGLTNGTKYGFLVRAYVNGAWTAFTTADNVYATPEAAVVTKPVVTATAGSGEVELEWNAVTGATKYNVYIYTTGYKLLTTTTSTSYTATGLTNGTKYGFLVRAYVNGAWTAFTTADNVYATPKAASTKPEFTATAGIGMVTLDWEPVEGATNYNVFTYLNGKYAVAGTTTDTTYTVTNLEAGTEYGFLVRAYVNNVWSPFTTADNIYATPTAALKPVLTVTAGTGSADLSWTAVAGATNYRVFSYLNGKYTEITVTSDTSCTATGLTSGTEYGFLVRAYVNNAWTAFSTDDVSYATIL